MEEKKKTCLYCISVATILLSLPEDKERGERGHFPRATLPDI